jgi:hypothetical protein
MVKNCSLQNKLQVSCSRYTTMTERSISQPFPLALPGTRKKELEFGTDAKVIKTQSKYIM